MNKIGIFAVSLVVLISVLLSSVTALDARGGIRARISARKTGETKTGADNFLESQAKVAVAEKTELGKEKKDGEKKVDLATQKTTIKVDLMNRKKMALLELKKAEITKQKAEAGRMKDAAESEIKETTSHEEKAETRTKSKVEDASQIDLQIQSDVRTAIENVVNVQDASQAEISADASEIVPSVLLEIESTTQLLSPESQYNPSKSLFEKKK